MFVRSKGLSREHSKVVFESRWPVMTHQGTRCLFGHKSSSIPEGQGLSRITPENKYLDLVQYSSPV
jgi:hypothetical protein